MMKLAYTILCLLIITKVTRQTPRWELEVSEVDVTGIPTIAPENPASVVTENCGHRNRKGVGVPLNDEDSGTTNFGEFPWMTALLKLEPVDIKQPDGEKINVYIGGGSLIYPNVVLTAAHTIAKSSDLRVRVGEWDTQTKKEIYPYQEVAVKEVVLHPTFNPKVLYNDIALVFLAEPVNMSYPNVGLACLPKSSAVAGSLCLASGWGKNKFGKEGHYSVILKKVELPVVDHSVCQEKLRGTRLQNTFILDPSFMCAGGEPDKDTCKGDGGSPLVCPVEGETDKYVQNGIVSWGIKCGTEGVPAAYTDVARFRSWIDETVAKHGYDPKSHTS